MQRIPKFLRNLKMSIYNFYYYIVNADWASVFKFDLNVLQYLMKSI